MHGLSQGWYGQFRSGLRTLLTGPQLLAFLPALTLGAFWLGGEGALLLIALVMPVGFALAGLYWSPGSAIAAIERDHQTGLPRKAALIAAADHFIASSDEGRETAVIALEIDQFDELDDRYGAGAAETAQRAVAARLSSSLRDTDAVAHLDGPLFAAALMPTRRADLEMMVQLSSRLQLAVREPIAFKGSALYLTLSVGFCARHRAPADTGEALLQSASAALRSAPGVQGTIRAYAPEMTHEDTSQKDLIASVTRALDQGEIRPFFQPQISTDTGAVSGFECLARWVHPDRGLVPPAEFLPTLHAAGLSERLSEIVLFHGLSALRSWQRAGFEVPSIAVNFSIEELSNARLVEKIQWELDRFDMDPGALRIDIRESIAAEDSTEIASQNISRLVALGCHVDLDDFGTSHTAITSIRRFSVSRIKVDRAFITQVDKDLDQRAMVSAILTLAERLGLETLAEGVETVGEHAVMAQLGCTHVQGFAVAQPLPFEDTMEWMERHREKLRRTPRIGGDMS